MQNAKYHRWLRLALLAVLLATACSVAVSLPAPGQLLATPAESALDMTQAAHSSPIMFVENAGQFPDNVRFQVRGANHVSWLAEDALWITVASTENSEQQTASGLLSARDLPDRRGAPIPGEGVNLRLSFVGANPDSHIEPAERLETRISFFTGRDSTEWHTAVPVWGQVRYVDLYPGIDLIVRGENSQVSMHLVADPGADTGQVRMQLEGADGVAVTGAALRVDTAVGTITLPLLSVGGWPAESSPLVPAIKHTAHRTFQITAPFYDTPADSSTATGPARSSVLLYSTYLGGISIDDSLGIAVDGYGNIYVAGSTISNDFPTTPGVFQPSYSGWHDAYVAKFNPTGNALIYASYLGGNDDECSFGGYPIEDCQMAIDSSGNAYISGFTLSSDFPTTAGAFDRTLGGAWDAFVTKLNANGTALVYSTYLGGRLRDKSSDIYVDENGSVYVTGYAESVDFPTTPGAYDTVGSRDAFVTKLQADGRALTFSTLLGGSDFDGSNAITVDGHGNAYIAGYTSSCEDFPITPRAFDPECVSNEGFIAKINASGANLLYATFLGGSLYDDADDIAIDTHGTAFVTGHTQSTDFPTTPGAFDTTYDGAWDDLYVAKLNMDGSHVFYSTLLGGSYGEIYYPSLALDRDGCAYLTGTTTSGDFPVTPGAFDTTLSGFSDAFVTRLSADGSMLLYSTYFGGSEGSSVDEYAAAMVMDSRGDVYVTGGTDAFDFPLTSNALDNTLSFMGGDAFVSRLALTRVIHQVYLPMVPRNH